MKIKPVSAGETITPPEYFGIGDIELPEDADPAMLEKTRVRLNDPSDPWTIRLSGMSWKEKSLDLKESILLQASRPTEESIPDRSKREAAQMDHFERVLKQTRATLRKHAHEITNLDLGEGPISNGEELMQAIESGSVPATWAEAVQTWMRHEIERLSALSEPVAKNSDASSAS